MSTHCTRLTAQCFSEHHIKLEMRHELVTVCLLMAFLVLVKVQWPWYFELFLYLKGHLFSTNTHTHTHTHDGGLSNPLQEQFLSEPINSSSGLQQQGLGSQLMVYMCFLKTSTQKPWGILADWIFHTCTHLLSQTHTHTRIQATYSSTVHWFLSIKCCYINKIQI